MGLRWTIDQLGAELVREVEHDDSTTPTSKSSASLNEVMQYRKIIAERFTYHFVVAK